MKRFCLTTGRTHLILVSNFWMRSMSGLCKAPNCMYPITLPFSSNLENNLRTCLNLSMRSWIFPKSSLERWLFGMVDNSSSIKSLACTSMPYLRWLSGNSTTCVTSSNSSPKTISSADKNALSKISLISLSGSAPSGISITISPLAEYDMDGLPSSSSSSPSSSKSASRSSSSDLFLGTTAGLGRISNFSKGMFLGTPWYPKSMYITVKSGKVVTSIMSCSKFVISPVIIVGNSPPMWISTQVLGKSPFWRAYPSSSLRFNKYMVCIDSSVICPASSTVNWVYFKFATFNSTIMDWSI